MTVTSVEVGGLEILDGTKYWVGEQTFYALVSAALETPRLLEMAGRHPAYTGSTPEARPIPLLVFLLRKSALDRITDYEALLAVLSNALGLVPLQWTDDAVTRRYLCHVGSADPDRRMSRVAVALTAPRPYAEVVP